jgi:hypothetical protein
MAAGKQTKAAKKHAISGRKGAKAGHSSKLGRKKVSIRKNASHKDKGKSASLQVTKAQASTSFTTADSLLCQCIRTWLHTWPCAAGCYQHLCCLP